MTIPPGTPNIITLNEHRFQPLSTQDVTQLQAISKVPAPVYKTVTETSQPTINYDAVAASFRSKAKRINLYIGLGVGAAVLIAIIIVVVILVKRKHNKSRGGGGNGGGNDKSLEEEEKKKKRRHSYQNQRCS